jgi:hypothetical protein
MLVFSECMVSCCGGGSRRAAAEKHGADRASTPHRPSANRVRPVLKQHGDRALLARSELLLAADPCSANWPI